MSRTNQLKRLGVGASCTVQLRFLHPKNKVKEVIQNQTATQQLNGLIVQSREVKSIHREDKECIIFRHEDFGGQLLWALERGVVVDIEGPEETFFNQPPPADAAAPPAAAVATDQAQQNNNNNEGVGMAKEKKVLKSFHQSSRKYWLVVATILMQMITWLQEQQLPWSMTTINQLQRMCQLLLSTQTISSLAGSTVAFATVAV